MINQLKKLRLSAIFIAFLSGITPGEAVPAAPTSAPGRTQGVAFGFGLGVKLLNLKNISTKTTAVTGGPDIVMRSADSFSNASTPAVSIYGRQYMPNLMYIPTFLGLEFDYLTDLHKRSLYTNLNSPGTPGNDTGYQYRETWDARLMLGGELWCWDQLDLWGQLGMQVTNFDYEGVTTEAGSTTRFKMSNNYALAPAGGLEIRYSQPGFWDKCVVTDFILGWTAGYRNAFAVMGGAPSGNNFKMAMSANWSHTFGLKVMFRF